MVNPNLFRDIEVSDADIMAHFQAAYGDQPSVDVIESAIAPNLGTNLDFNQIVKARVVAINGGEVVLDVGLKSEGVVSLDEWDDKSEVAVGREVEVLVEDIESDTGMIVVSKRRADRILNWRRIVDTTNEGDVVKGRVLRKIKGGLLVDIGVPVFLPASQVDIRRPADVGEYIGQDIEAKVLKIDKERRNIVISRRKLVEEERNIAKARLLAEIEVGQIRKGVVKNLADFGAFVDLGGIDGLLHITDMSWDRIDHPSQLLKVDQELEVKVLAIDRDREKIALGLKQKQENPWEKVAERYPVGSRVRGEVVNIMNYGAFVKLEPGVEGLVHISEMSWTKKVSHPSEVVKKGDRLRCVVLNVDQEKMRISLGLKQMTEDPWLRAVPERYQPGMVIRGKVTKITNFGVFVELEPELEGLLHVSELADQKVENPQDVVQIGEEVDVKILRVDTIDRKIGLSKKRAEWATSATDEGGEQDSRRREKKRRGGLGDDPFGGLAGGMFTPPQD